MRATSRRRWTRRLRRAAKPRTAGYPGDNLVFVFGPPRSGTTWVFNLLCAHPDVVAATVDNLGVRIRPGATLETNAFQKRRPFSDEELSERFAALSARNPGRRVVEKTPVHVFYADRIRRVFPRCRMVLLERDPRDIVNSMLHVSRDPDRWWRAVPASAPDAAEMWLRYAEAGMKCRAAHEPHVVRYEELFADTEGTLRALLAALDLLPDHVEAQIAAAARGRGIPIPGVYREGAVGGWRRDLSADEVRAVEEIAGGLLERLGYTGAQNG